MCFLCMCECVRCMRVFVLMFAASVVCAVCVLFMLCVCEICPFVSVVWCVLSLVYLVCVCVVWLFVICV